ncbi:MAG: hypothetical protein WCO05_02700 [Candidatus Moraniibacteriota bacterium]|jgi:hypothetical protein
METNDVSDGLVKEKKSHFAEIMRPIMWFLGGSTVLPALFFLSGGFWPLSIVLIVFGVMIILVTNDLYNLKRQGFWGMACLFLLFSGFLFLSPQSRSIAVYPIIFCVIFVVFSYKKFIN